jgi:pilus assembly protein Flp/PilA
VNVVKKLSNFLKDESGAAAAEYALILAIIGGGIAVAAITLGANIGTSITHAATCIATPSAANCG